MGPGVTLHPSQRRTNASLRRLRPTVARLTPWVLAATVALLLAAALSPARAAAEPAPQARWTVMVYMCGDNNLEPWITHDIDAEMAAVGSNADVQVVALADRSPGYSTDDGDWTGTLLFNVAKGMTATPENAVADWGERDMGSPQTLIDFVTWTRANYPADRYALVFWDHGWGWWPGETMVDETSGDTLDMDEIRRAMDAAGGVNMVGMETCLGQMIEVEAEFRGFARAIAASEDSTGYTTFDYRQILSALQATPTMTAAELAVVAARSMKTGHDKWTLTASAVALNRSWDSLASAVSDLAWDLAYGLPKYHKAYAVARRHAAVPPQSYPEVRDLYDVARELRSHVGSALIKRDCTRVLVSLRKVVLYEWSTPAEGDLHGISIFWPSAPAPPRPGSSFSQWVGFPYYCSQLTFTRMTYWGDFLTAWGAR